MDALTLVTQAAFLVSVIEALVEASAAPLFDRLNLDKFWLMYVTWILAAGVVWLSGINLFAEFLPNPLAGQILTAIVAGRGSNFVHDLFSAVRATKMRRA